MDMDHRLKGVLLKVAFAMLASVLAISESNIKSIVSGWLDDCRIIIDVGKVVESQDNVCNASIRLLVIGETFPNFRLRLKTNEKFKESVDIAKIYFPSEIIGNNLSVHPLAGEFCRIDAGTEVFCIIKSSDNAEIKLSELSSNYNYIFDVELSLNNQKCKHLDEMYLDDIINIYSQSEKEAEDRLRCKVEAGTWLNFIARQGPEVKFISLSVLVFFILIIFATFKRSKPNENS